MLSLTRAQMRTYEFIQNFFQNHGYAPTFDEIAGGIGIQSRGVVHRYVKALVSAHLIAVESRRARGIRLLAISSDEGLPPPSAPHSSTANLFIDPFVLQGQLPILGRIAAGQPIEAIQDHQAFDVNTLLGRGDYYLLEVRGDSMIGDNICDGDLIICQRADLAPNGAIVVALVDDQEATLKRLYRNDDSSITLVPSNVKLTPMVYPGHRIKVQGIFKGLIRLNQ